MTTRQFAAVACLASLSGAVSGAAAGPGARYVLAVLEPYAGVQHMLLDSERLTDAWLSEHDWNSGGRQYGDNAAVADFWYDAAHRRLQSRSLSLRDVDDPADLRLGRAPGRYPHDIDFMASHAPGTVVGHVGFEGWGGNGFSAYQAAAQGMVLTPNTMAYCIANAPGTPGRARAGWDYEGGELVQHLCVLPTGDVVVGYNTDPSKPARLIVRGDLVVEGRVIQQQ